MRFSFFFQPFVSIAAAAFLAGSLLAAANPEALTLSAYLEQVRVKHDGVKGLALSSAGAAGRASEGSLLTSPSLFSTLQHSDDAKPTMAPTFMGTQTVADIFAVGVGKVTVRPFGEAVLQYPVDHHLRGESPALTLPSFIEAHPTLELSQALWRNWMGAETKAQVAMLEAQALALHYQDDFQIKWLIAQAEATYWRLASARESLEVEEESLDRAVKIRDWNARRAKLLLADRADLLQAQAGLEARKLELQTSATICALPPGLSTGCGASIRSRFPRSSRLSTRKSWPR